MATKELTAMKDSLLRALDNAAASSAMEGLPLTKENRIIIEKIIAGELSLEDYLKTLQNQSEIKSGLE